MNRFLYLFLIFALAACKNETKKAALAPKNYILVDQDGIDVEVFDDTVTDPNRYTANNQVFTTGRSFRYKFAHLTRGDEIQFFKKLPPQNNEPPGWEFVDQEDANDSRI